MRGRPAKPTRLKVAEGNPGKRKLNRKELKEKTRAPICPTWLCHDAQLKWKALCKVLSRRKLIREEDQMNLAAICHAWATEKAAIIALSKLPADAQLFVKAGKTFVANPLQQIIRQNQELIYKLGAHFGFDPASRARLTFEDDEIAELLPKGLEHALSGPVEHDPSDNVVIQ